MNRYTRYDFGRYPRVLIFITNKNKNIIYINRYGRYGCGRSTYRG